MGESTAIAWTRPMTATTVTEQRISIARAALTDMGRPDLAAAIFDAAERPQDYIESGNDIVWDWRQSPNDSALILRAGAIAHIATDDPDSTSRCERCCRAHDDRCLLITSRQLLDGVDCARWDGQ